MVRIALRSTEYKVAAPSAPRGRLPSDRCVTAAPDPSQHRAKLAALKAAARRLRRCLRPALTTAPLAATRDRRSGRRNGARSNKGTGFQARQTNHYGLGKRAVTIANRNWRCQRTASLPSR
jgi:hypothetical protein